jgi:hypothetical protein
MRWYETFDAVFWITITTIITGTVALGVRYCLKSKCEHCSVCCGLVEIDRRVDIELEERKTELDFGVPPSPINKLNKNFTNKKAAFYTFETKEETDEVTSIHDNNSFSVNHSCFIS